jgi:lipopolysaccharide transport system ATP-binding protein
MSDLAIKVEHLSKKYRLGEINNGTLWQDIQTWIAIKRRKEDPHSKIGEDKYSGGKDEFWALKDVSFELKQGDRLGIIGKNGAGKSTLLKILSRITTPTEGIIKIKGKIASLLEVGTGFHGELSGRENIYINGAILGMKKRRIDELLDNIIDFSGIEKHIDTPVKRYSSGMYVRLAFAVAAHLDSDILIADEVLAVGDAEFQKKALGKMQDLSTSEGRTVLFVSHNMGAVKNLCNYGIIIEDGNIKFNGTITDAIKNYTNENMYKETSNANKAFISELNAELEVHIIAESGISPFKPFAIEVILNAKEKKQNISIHIGIGNNEIEDIYSFASAETDDVRFDMNIGRNKYTCYLPKLSLAAGIYRLRIAITDPFFHLYYNNKDFLYFSVLEGKTENRDIINHPIYGLVYPQHEWKS